MQNPERRLPVIPPSSRRLVIDMYSSRYPTWCMPESHVEKIREALPDDWRLVRITEEADGSGDGAPGGGRSRLEAVRDAEVYCGFGISRELLRAADRLRWVHSGAAGVGGSLFPEMRRSDVIFTNSAGVHGVPVAEHVLALIFHFARGLDRVSADRCERRWDRDRLSRRPLPVAEVTGARLGVVGFGGIGRELGRRAKGLGMEVWAVRRHPDAGDRPGYVDRVMGADALGALLEASDYVVLAVPHTSETDGLIGAAELDGMKKGAVLINVARGRVVDEEALIEALREGRIRGAGLDVFEEEPLPAASPFWGLENACITPHIGGTSPGFWARETELILDNLRRYLNGEPLRNVVDKEAGY